MCKPIKKAFFIPLLLLSSCLSMTEKEMAQNVINLPSLEQSVDHSLSSPYFSEGDWPEKEWWNIFHDEHLSSLIDFALQNNPSILAIKQRVELARQNAKVVRSNLFPLVFFDFNETWQYLSKNGLYRTLNDKIPLNANLVDLSLSFNYEFDFWSKNLNSFRSALGKAKADEAEEAQVELITTTAVAQAYFALKTNLKKKSLLQEITQIKKEIFDLQMLMQDKALFSRLVPLRGEEDVQDAEKLLVAIQDEVVIDKHLLNILIGKGPDEDLYVDESLASLPRTLTLPTSLSLNLLSRRPDLMAQIWRVESLGNEVGVAKADFFPNINLVGLVGLESILYRTLFKESSKTQALKPAINLPIFTAGAIRANVRAKKAEFDQAVYDYNEKILESSKEVADLMVFAQTVYEQKYLQENIVSEAKELYDLVKLRYEKGLDNLITLYSSQLRFLERELEDVTLLYNQYLASIRLIKSLGGGYISNYLPIKSDKVDTHDAQ